MPSLTLDKAEAPSESLSIPMRDGVRLAAQCWGDTDVPRPIVLERTPYGIFRTDQSERLAGAAAPQSRQALAGIYRSRGCVYVVQACRGTGQSGGRFVKYLQEPDDTIDTLQWLRAQKWCDGFVAMVGFSYGATCQLPALSFGADGPDAVVLDCGGFDDAFTSGVRQGGAFALKQATWAYAQALREAKTKGDGKAVEAIEAQDLHRWLALGPWVSGHTPLEAAPDQQESLSVFWQNSMRTPFWEQPGLKTPAEELQGSGAHALLVTSWHDTSLRATLNNFAALAARPGGKGSAQLVVGPWTHGDRWSQVAGEVDFGSAAPPENGLGASFPALRLQHIEQAREPAGAKAPAVRWFEMGGGSGRRGEAGKIDYGGRWREADSWPPRTARRIDFLLTAGGLALSPGGDLRRSFLSDPDAPYPTLGGAINSGAPLMEGGMWDQSLLENRSDVVRLDTPELEQPFILAGPLTAHLNCYCSAPDFDLAIRLVDVFPDGGPCLNISDGITRARSRAGDDREVFAVPGELVSMVVTANPTGVRIEKNHRLRLEITGSNFPCFDMNPQTGAPSGYPGNRNAADISIVSNAQNRSVLTITTLQPGDPECLFS